jgi:hypothetical protein
MKKLLLLITALSFLFLASGCGQKAFNPDRTKPVGMILVNGDPEPGDTERMPGEMIYAEFADDQYRFPLDAAMVYFFDYDEENSYAGDQNCISLTFAADANTKQVGAEATCRYIVREGSENTVNAYHLYYDGKGLGFYPMKTLAAFIIDSSGLGITIDELYKFKVECEKPAAFFTMSCRKGEEELAFATIRPEEIEDYMKYPLPEGTDNVEINSFDANAEFIGRKELEPGVYNYTAAYDIGGQFQGAKTIHLVWQQPAE